MYIKVLVHVCTVVRVTRHAAHTERLLTTCVVTFRTRTPFHGRSLPQTFRTTTYKTKDNSYSALCSYYIRTVHCPVTVTFTDLII